MSKYFRRLLTVLLLVGMLIPLLPVTEASAEASSVEHVTADGSYLNRVPLFPKENESVNIWFRTTGPGYVNRAAVYYTTDGREPLTPAATTITRMAYAPAESGEDADWWRIVIDDDLPAGTLVYYKIAAWYYDPDSANDACSNRVLYADFAPGAWQIQDPMFAKVFSYIVGPSTSASAMAYVSHDRSAHVLPANPSYADDVRVQVKVGGDAGAMVRLIYTTDGSEPQLDDSTHTATNGSLATMQSVATGSDNYYQESLTYGIYEATIPRQGGGTQVRYKIAVWYSGLARTYYAHNSDTTFWSTKSAAAKTFGYVVDVPSAVTHMQGFVDGGYSQYMVSPATPSANDTINFTVNTGTAGKFNNVCLYYTTDGSLPSGHRGIGSNARCKQSSTTVNWQFNLLSNTFSNGTTLRYIIDAWHSGWSATSTSIYAESTAYYPVTDQSKATVYSLRIDTPEDFFNAPGWAADAIVYQVFVDRFYDGDTDNNVDTYTDSEPQLACQLVSFNGGDLAGITEKINAGYFNDLGVDTLWLSPIFETDVYHGYNVIDYWDVEDNYGTNDDLGTLVETAHAHDLRVILDWVPNHTSNINPWFVTAQSDSNSPYYHWYLFDPWPLEYAHFFTARAQAKLNNEHQDVRDTMIEAANFWIQEYDVDGLRLDFAWGMTPGFWTDFRNAIKAANSDAFIFGELWDRSATSAEIDSLKGRLDGCLEFDQVGTYTPLVGFFGTQARNVTDFDGFLTYHHRHGTDYLLPFFIDNHDIERGMYSTTTSGATYDQAINRMKLAAVAQFTVVGPPVIYYGNEWALSQESTSRQDNSRVLMPWDDKPDRADEVYAHYAALAQIRASHSALISGTFTSIHQGTDTYAYRRYNDDENIVVVFNRGAGQSQPLVLSSTGWGSSVAKAQDLLSGTVYNVSNGSVTISLAATTGAILVPVVGPTSVTISGPTTGVLNHAYTFSAAVQPTNVTLPTYQWYVGSTLQPDCTSDTCDIFWSAPGTYTVKVVVTNSAGSRQDTHTMTISGSVVNPNSVTLVSDDADDTVKTNVDVTFTADVSPDNATLPLTFGWYVDGTRIETDTLTVGNSTPGLVETFTYLWEQAPESGNSTVKVVVTNAQGVSVEEELVMVIENPLLPVTLYFTLEDAPAGGLGRRMYISDPGSPLGGIQLTYQGGNTWSASFVLQPPSRWSFDYNYVYWAGLRPTAEDAGVTHTCYLPINTSPVHCHDTWNVSTTSNFPQ